MLFSRLNACAACPILDDTSLSMLLSVEMKRPRYLKSCASSSSFPLTVTGFLDLDFTFMNLVFAGWILSPTVRAVLSTRSVYFWMSLWQWESRPISSAKLLSSRRSRRPQANPLGLSLVAFRITQSMTVRNSKGEMMQPCLTPVFTWNQLLCCPSCLTQHLFSVYVSLMMLMTLVGRQYTCRIFRSDGWCMLSNAFSKPI